MTKYIGLKINGLTQILNQSANILRGLTSELWFNTLQNKTDRFHDALCALFKVTPASSVGSMLENMCDKTIKTYFFSREQSSAKVHARDISMLDVASDERSLSEWGGIAEFSSRVNDVVSEYIN